MPYDDTTDPTTNAIMALEAAGWTVKDADRDGVWMTHPEAPEQYTLYVEGDLAG